MPRIETTDNFDGADTNWTKVVDTGDDSPGTYTTDDGRQVVIKFGRASQNSREAWVFCPQLYPGWITVQITKHGSEGRRVLPDGRVLRVLLNSPLKRRDQFNSDPDGLRKRNYYRDGSN